MPCEWCGTIFCWDLADEAGDARKRHCTEQCRKLREQCRHRIRNLRGRCERGEIPRFPTRPQAVREAKRLAAEEGGRFRAYDRPCDFCHGWHVLHKIKHRSRPHSKRRQR